MILDQYDELFIHNEWYDKYKDLIESNKDQVHIKFKTQKHHIIPRSYYRYYNIPINNDKDNMVVLYHKDHILAHYYLSLCLQDNHLVYCSQYAVMYMLNTNKVAETEQQVIKDSIQYQQLKEAFLMNQAALHVGKPAWNKGKKMPQQFIDKCKKAHKGIYPTEETKRKMSESSKGKNSGGVYIHKNGVVKHIKDEELQLFLSDGWCVGNPKWVTIGKRCSQKVFVFLEDEEKRVRLDQLDSYLSLGWKKGRSEKTKKNISASTSGRPAWNKNKKLSDAHRKNLSLNHAQVKDTIFVNKDGLIKRIPTEQLKDYELLGYKRGMK